MKFFKKNVCEQQVDVNQGRRFTMGQYIAAVIAMLLSVTAFSYAAGLLTLITFTSGTAISATDVNANFNSINDQLATMTATMNTMSTTIGTNVVPAGTLVAFAGANAPAGYIKCPTTSVAAIVSRTAYPALFSAIGVTWGAGDGSTTFVMPWFPEGYALLQANANVSSESVGEVISHTHRPVYGGTPSNTTTVYDNTVNQSLGAGASSMGAHVLTIEATGGLANMAAGTKVTILVKI